MSDIVLVQEPVTREALLEMARAQFGDFVKAVVDVQKGIMAIGASMHVDEEQYLLERGSQQQNLWGVNLYPEAEGNDMVEFDSMINLRPSQGNRSRSVDDPQTREKIYDMVKKLMK